MGADFQNAVQSFLLLCCLLAVPLLLIPIPVIEYLHHKHTAYGELEEVCPACFGALYGFL